MSKKNLPSRNYVINTSCVCSAQVHRYKRLRSNLEFLNRRFAIGGSEPQTNGLTVLIGATNGQPESELTIVQKRPLNNVFLTCVHFSKKKALWVNRTAKPFIGKCNCEDVTQYPQ